MADVKTEWFGKEAKDSGINTIKRSIAEIGIIIEGQAVAMAPVDMNQLRESITREKVTPLKTLVGTNLSYAPYVEYGTRPHKVPIAALKGWAKRVLGDEDLAYAVAKKIAEKGTIGQPYLRPAFDYAQGKAKLIVIKNGRNEFA